MLPCIYYFKLVFPTERDSATFWDKGTEVSSLSLDKGTTGRAQNLAMGRDRTITILLSKSGTGPGGDNQYLFSIISYYIF